MKTPRPAADADRDAEIAGLVRHLQEAHERLEELSGGEVDAVVLPSGQSLLLREAQERLRQSETIQRRLAATQTSILNALPAHIALVDEHGVILAVNERWQDFAIANALLSPNFGVGQNYLEICEDAHGACAEEAHQAAAGIRAVLSGAIGEFALEYPCHSPTEQRWFRLMVDPVKADPQSGAAVMHLNITERRQAEQALRESNEKFRQLADNITDAFWIRSPDLSAVHYISPAFERIWGRSVQSLYANPQQWSDFILPEDRKRVLDAFAALTGDAPSLDLDYRIVRPDGEVRGVRVRGFQVRNPAGQLIRHAGIVTDITERKLAAQELQWKTAFLEAQVNSSLDAILIVDGRGKKLLQNQRMIDLWKFPQHIAEEESDDNQLRWVTSRTRNPEQFLKKVDYLYAHPDDISEDEIELTDGTTMDRYSAPVRGIDGSYYGRIWTFRDITARKAAEQVRRRSEERFRFLNALSDATRPLVDPEQIMAVTARMLGEHLHASRCAYADVERGGERFTILHDYTDGCASTAGTYQLSHFGARAVATLHRGETLIIRSVDAELLPGEGAEMFNAIGVKAIITCPLVKEGGLRAMMAVHQTTPREWQSGETTLVEEVVERCWATIERRAAEEKTRLVAERLTSTLESLTDGFYNVDREWRLTYINREAERMLCRTRAELLGRNLWEQFPEAKGTPFSSALERALAENVAVQIEDFYPPLDCWFEVRIYPSAQGLAVYFRDVSEPRQAREALRMSEERFRLVAKATNDAIWDWNLGANTVWWNEGFEALFGFQRHEIEPTIEGWTSRIHPADRARIVDDIDRSIHAGEEKWSGDYRFLRKNGQYAYVFDRGFVLRDPAGKPLRMIGGVTDLTERKAAADRLAEQAALLNAASDAIMLIDLADRIVLWNRSAEQIFGWTAAEAIGKKSRELFGAEAAKFDAALQTLLAKDIWRGELLKHTKDGRVLMMDARWTLVHDDAGKPKSILAINTDITERKKLEAQFLRVQRMESIGTLAGGIAHDLNNILAPIMMSVSLLQREVTSEVGQEMLGTLQVCSQRGADLVRQVLSFARGIEGQRIVVNPVHLMREIQKIIRETFPKNIVFKFNFPRDLWTVTGDPTQLHQVFMNLCVNARDAMPMGGTLTATTENIMVDDVYAGMNPDAKPGAHVIVKVSDTGTGIPPDVRERIFEPFFTTKEIGKGTGLGLSTTLAIVRIHGGFIQVYSEPGQGAHFKVYLPANTTAAVDEHIVVERAALPRGQGELVLVVDDEEGIRNIAQKTLAHYGYRVVLAANGAEAVALYATLRDTVAVVLTDMAMPVMDGPATIVALKTLNPQVKVIGSSGLAVEASVAKAAGAGVQHFIPKPYTAEAMLTTVHRVLHGTD